MAQFLRGKQSGIQKDLSDGLSPELFALDDFARCGINSQISTIAYDPVQSLLAAGTSDTQFGSGQIYVFGQRRVSVVFQFPRKASAKFLQFCANKLISVDSKNEICVYSLETKRVLITYTPPGQVTALLTDPSLDYAFLGLQNGDIIAYDLDRESLTPYKIPNLWAARNPRPRLCPVIELTFSPRDIGKILVGYPEGAVVFTFKQNLAQKYFEYEVPPGALGGNSDVTFHELRKPKLTRALWHPNGIFALTIHDDNSLVFWDTKDGRKILARTIQANNVDQPGGTQPVSPGVSLGSNGSITKAAWCVKENGEDSGLLIAGGRSVTELSKGLTFLDFGPSPNYQTSTWPMITNYFESPRQQTNLPTPPGAELLDFCLIPRSSPYYGGAHDPIAVMTLLSSGELITMSFPSGHPITTTNMVHPYLSFVQPFVNKISYAPVDRGAWLGLRERRSQGPKFVLGGAEAKKHLKRFEHRNILATAHADGTVRLWDPGHDDEIENSDVIQVDLARAVGRVRNTEVTEISIAGSTGELSVGLRSGEVVVFRWGSNSRLGFEEPAGTNKGPGQLTNITHRTDPGLKKGMLPLTLLDMGQGAVTALKHSEVGFVAAGFEGGGFAVLDLRGPAIIHTAHLSDFLKASKRSSSFRKTRAPEDGPPEWPTSIEFGVLTLDNDDYSSICCFVGTNRGNFATFKVLPAADGRYTVAFVAAIALDDKVISINPLDADRGSPALATPNAVGGLRNGVKINGVVIAVTASGCRLFKPAASKGAHKSWDDYLCDSAAVVKTEGRGYSLVGLFGDANTRAFSIPGLKEIGCSRIGHFVDMRRLSESCVSPTGTIISWTGPSEVGLFTAWGSGTGMYGVKTTTLLVDADYIHRRPSEDQLFNPQAVIPPRPTITNFQWISGTQYVSPADMDILIGGPDRPPSKRVQEQMRIEEQERRRAAREGRTIPGQASDQGSQEGYWSYMQRQVQERTERLGMAGDQMDRLEENSSNWARDVNKYVQKQKRGLVLGDSPLVVAENHTFVVMAEEDAENAFFQAQAMNANMVDYNTVEGQEADNSDSDDYDPSRSLQDQYSGSLTDSKQSENISSTPAPFDSNSPNEAPPAQVLNPDQQPGDDAQNQSPSRDESQQESASMPPSGAPAQQNTKTIGGFVVEDEDEDDKGDPDYEPPAVLGEDMNTMPPQPFPGNANQATSTPDVSFNESAQDPASSKNVSNSSFSPASKNDASPATGQPIHGSQALQSENAQGSAAPTPTPDPSSTTRGRLPHDRVGILEDRIQEDPRGDTAAWLELINEHRSRNRIDNAREAYERFLKVFPLAAEQWVAYAIMESEINELFRLEQIFNRTLLTIPNVQLWSVYLDYVRRRNPLTTDSSGQARTIISSAYDLALQYIGMDKDSGSIWADFIQFIRSGPGNVGGSGWQDQQKMDLLRKGYQRAICVPTQVVNTLWKEYDQFEMGLNKLTGRKFLQEQSPAYMTARSSYTELQNITRDLNRTSIPRLPPVPGSEGDIEFSQQVEIWKRWIEWEKMDPLVLKEDEPSVFKTRVVYVYKQALMALRFLPEVWFDAAEFCFLNDMEDEANEFLRQGVEANPESCLLAFKQADRLEITTETEHDPIKRGSKVREPYDKLLDALYDLIAKARTRESQDVARMEQTFANLGADKQSSNEDEDDDQSETKVRESVKNAQIEAVRNAHAIQIGIVSRTISFAWIALMRSMRRIQGKGKPGEVPGSRQIFADARKRGRITSDVYIASALIEYHCYKDPAATKIFERGAKLFPEDETFALEYLKHLIDINDITNARAVFEMTVRKLASNPANVHKAKPIFAFLHEYESRYGDLTQVISLESRMRELYPDDPSLEQFTHRYATPHFNPTAVRPIISPSQTRPKAAYPSQPQESRHGTPTPRYPDTSVTNSPKRPLDDFDDDLNRPRKFMRGESPLKAVTGRRLDQQKRPPQVNGGAQTGAQYRPQGSPAPLPRDIVYLLSVIPPASAYTAGRFSPEKLADLLRRIELPSSISQIPLPQSVRGLGTGQPLMGMGGYTGVYRPGL